MTILSLPVATERSIDLSTISKALILIMKYCISPTAQAMTLLTISDIQRSVIRFPLLNISVIFQRLLSKERTTVLSTVWAMALTDTAVKLVMCKGKFPAKKSIIQ